MHLYVIDAKRTGVKKKDKIAKKNFIAHINKKEETKDLDLVKRRVVGIGVGFF